MAFLTMFAILNMLNLVKYSYCMEVDYCTFSKQHTLCKYKDGPSSKCSGYKHFQFTKEMQEHIVLVHNDIREKVASGEENQGLLGGQPSASNMQKLEWDEELATIAQRWTDQCVQFNENQHDIYKDTRRFEVGQNIITATTKSTSPPDIVLLVMNWYKQVQYVFPSDIDKFTTVYRGGHMLGQYSQMVWAKSHYVGCGMARYKKLTVENKDTDFYLYRLVCNYGPTGNVYGEQMYLRGRPCSRCAQKQCDEKWTSLCDRRSSFNILNRYNILMDFPSEYEVQGEPEQENTYYFNPDETQLFKQKTGHLLEDLVINNINEEQLNITEKMNDFYHVISPNKPQVHNVVKDIEDELQFNIPTEGFTVKTTTIDPDPNHYIEKIDNDTYNLVGQGVYKLSYGKWQAGECDCTFLYRDNTAKMDSRSFLIYIFLILYYL